MILSFLFLVFCVTYSQPAAVTGCGPNETTPDKQDTIIIPYKSTCNETLTRACNACLDCSPCICKFGYIRAYTAGPCITSKECHDLHARWLHEAKYEGKQANFCSAEKTLA